MQSPSRPMTPAQGSTIVSDVAGLWTTHSRQEDQ